MKINFSYNPAYKMIAGGFPYPGRSVFFLNIWPFVMELNFEKSIPVRQPHQGKKEIARRAGKLRVIK